MQITPEIKAQLAEQKKQCVYCKLVAREIPPKVVFEDAVTLALLDIYPAKKGHTVFTLKEHYPIIPLIPAKEFAHFFSLVPALSKAIQSAMVVTGINLLIANGGVAGQQFPHFLAHFLPREAGDGLYNFLFKPGKSLAPENIEPVQRQMLQLMQTYFAKDPQSWHTGKGETPSFLVAVQKNATILYEDEKVLVLLPSKSVIPGEICVYSKREERDIAKLSSEDSTHLFFVASFAASALFDGLAAQGTNLLLRSGFTDDNPEGRLLVQVLPRKQGDGLQGIFWESKPAGYNLDEIASRIKDRTWNVKYQELKKESPLPAKPVVVPAPTSPSKMGTSSTMATGSHLKKTAEQEIREAMMRILGKS